MGPGALSKLNAYFNLKFTSKKSSLYCNTPANLGTLVDLYQYILTLQNRGPKLLAYLIPAVVYSPVFA